MGILFVIALLLAWPTFGMSIIAWFVLMFLKAKGNVDKVDRREEIKNIIEPLFQKRFRDFFMALSHISIVTGCDLTDEEAHQCGHHIMNYLAHNPSEAAILMQGLEEWRTAQWRTDGPLELCDLVATAEHETEFANGYGKIHLVAYRAIESIMTNNKNIKCFSKIDFGSIVEFRERLEFSLKVDEVSPTKNAIQGQPQKSKISNLSIISEALSGRNVLPSWAMNEMKVLEFSEAVKNLAYAGGVSKSYISEYMSNDVTGPSILHMMSVLERKGDSYMQQKAAAVELLARDWNKLDENKKAKYIDMDTSM